MLGRNTAEPALFQMVNLEARVPANHLLRKIDAVLDLGFVREQVAACYSAGMGRPSVDPELVVRMMLLAELYDLGDRELCDEIAMHAGMRWFCRLDFHDPVPDHSTLSKLRNERWAESGLWERLRDEVLRQCAEAGLTSGRHLSVDGTEVEANASMKSLKPLGPRPEGRRGPPPESAVKSAARQPEDGAKEAQRGTGRAKEPQPEGAWRAHGEKFSNESHRSVTDPDARLYRKGDHRAAKLSYLAHDLIDTKSRVVLRRRASLATGSAEREVALEMMDEVLAEPEILPKRTEILTADANYGTGEFVADILERDVLPHVPLLAGEEMEAVPTWKRKTADLEQLRKRKEKVRVAEARNRVREIHRTRGYKVSRKLRIRSEHVFAEGKEHHGLGHARRRGLEKLQVQCELSATVQNLRRLVGFLGRRRRGAAAAALPRPGMLTGRVCMRAQERIRHLVHVLQARIERVRQWLSASGPLQARMITASSTAF